MILAYAEDGNGRRAAIAAADEVGQNMEEIFQAQMGG